MVQMRDQGEHTRLVLLPRILCFTRIYRFVPTHVRPSTSICSDCCRGCSYTTRRVPLPSLASPSLASPSLALCRAKRRHGVRIRNTLPVEPMATHARTKGELHRRLAIAYAQLHRRILVIPTHSLQPQVCSAWLRQVITSSTGLLCCHPATNIQISKCNATPAARWNGKVLTFPGPKSILS